MDCSTRTLMRLVIICCSDAADMSRASSRNDHQRPDDSKARYRHTSDDDDDGGGHPVDTADWRHSSSLMRDRQTSTDSGKVRREPGNNNSSASAEISDRFELH